MQDHSDTEALEQKAVHTADQLQKQGVLKSFGQANQVLAADMAPGLFCDQIERPCLGMQVPKRIYTLEELKLNNIYTGTQSPAGDRGAVIWTGSLSVCSCLQRNSCRLRCNRAHNSHAKLGCQHGLVVLTVLLKLYQSPVRRQAADPAGAGPDFEQR